MIVDLFPACRVLVPTNSSCMRLNRASGTDFVAYQSTRKVELLLILDTQRHYSGTTTCCDINHPLGLSIGRKLHIYQLTLTGRGLGKPCGLKLTRYSSIVTISSLAYAALLRRMSLRLHVLWLQRFQKAGSTPRDACSSWSKAHVLTRIRSVGTNVRGQFRQLVIADNALYSIYIVWCDVNDDLAAS